MHRSSVCEMSICFHVMLNLLLVSPRTVMFKLCFMKAQKEEGVCWGAKDLSVNTLKCRHCFFPSTFALELSSLLNPGRLDILGENAFSILR